MGEIIQIHVGQAGVQIGNACWELYCLEHGVKVDGSLCDCPIDDTFKNFFSFKDANRVVPRTVMVDSEPTVIDQIRTGPYGCLYNPGSLISGKEDSGSNFARGYYTMGAELIDITMEAIRMVAESCCNLRGFLVFRSVGGGTGSGLGNLIAEQLKDEYDRISKVEFVIFPSPSISPLIVEPYNALLATHLGMDSIECTFILDNEALYDICAAKLNICSPRYKNLNRIIGQIASTFTTSQRFASDSSMTFAEFQTNLVPYPRIHFPVVSYAPFIAGTGLGYTNLTTEQITSACFEPCSQLVRCNPADGKYMSCVLLYRGQVQASFINSSICHLRSTGAIRFVDWQPTGFKIQLNTEPPFTVPCGGLSNSNKALLTLSNNTIIQKAWCRLMSKFNRLYSRQAFIHHYLAEGLEEDAFREASEDICTLIYDYQEVDKSANGEIAGVNEQFLIPYDQCPDFNECGTRSLRRSVRTKSVERAVNNNPRINTRNTSDDEQGERGVNKNARISNRATSDDEQGEHPWSGKSNQKDEEHGSEGIVPGLSSLNFFFGNENTCKCECHIMAGTPCAKDGGGTPMGKPPLSGGGTHTGRTTPPGGGTGGGTGGGGGRYSAAPSKGRSSRKETNMELMQEPEMGTQAPRLPTRSKSNENIQEGNRTSDGRSQRRSKSYEPYNSGGGGMSLPSSRPKHYKNFDQGFDTEACRAKARFCQCYGKCADDCCSRSCPQPCERPVCGTPCCGRCNPGDVLLLPPPRKEGKENLGEALSAKERFCNSICKPKCCKIDECEDTCCQVADPCRDSCPKQSCGFARDPCIAPFCCFETKLPYFSPCKTPCNDQCCAPKVCREDACCTKSCCYNECEKPPCAMDPCCSPKVCREDPCYVKTCCYDECEIPKPPCLAPLCDDMSCSDLIKPYPCEDCEVSYCCARVCGFPTKRMECFDECEEKPCVAPCPAPCCSPCRDPCGPFRDTCSPCRDPCSRCRRPWSQRRDVCSPCRDSGSPCRDTCSPCRGPSIPFRDSDSPCRDSSSPCRDSCSPCRDQCSPCRDPCSPCSPCRDPCSPCSPCRDPCSPCAPCTTCRDSCSPCREPCSPCRDSCSPCRDLCTTCRGSCSPCRDPCSPCRDSCSPCRDPCSPCRDPCSPCSPCAPCAPCRTPCNSPCGYTECCREVLMVENLVKAENYPICPCPDPCCYQEPQPCCGPPCPCEDPCCTALVKPCCECEEPPPCCSPCSPPCNSPCCSPRACCENLVYPNCCNNECCCPQEIKWVVRPPKRRKPQIRQRCFCCLDTDDIMYCNSDYRLPPMCCRPQRRQRQKRDRCFCHDEICGIFNASSAILVAPRCCSSFCYCVQEEEVSWCPNDDRVCECFPESRTVFRPRVSCDVPKDDDDPRSKPRFPGPVE